MNCAVCRAFLRNRNSCPGCRVDDPHKPKTRRNCRIRNCRERRGADFCTDCARFPCEHLTHLDQRYRGKYGMSMIENLRRIKAGGVAGFVAAEKTRWTCPGCGGTICVHQASCPGCARRWR